MCVCALVLQLGPQQQIRTPESRAYDFGGPSLYVGAHARPGDGVLFLGTLFRKAELGYPAQFRNVSDFALAVTPAAGRQLPGLDKPFAQTLPLMLGHRRIWVLGARPSGQLSAGLLRQRARRWRAVSA